MKQFSPSLPSELTMCLNGGPFHALRSVAQGIGLEAVRLIMARYGPRTAQSKRACFEATMTTTQAKWVESFASTLLQLQRNIKLYEELVATPFDEDLAVTILTEAGVPELRSKLEMSSRGVSYTGGSGAPSSPASSGVATPQQVRFRCTSGTRTRRSPIAPQNSRIGQHRGGATEPDDLDDGMWVCHLTPRGFPDAGIMGKVLLP